MKIEQITERFGVAKFNGLWYPVDNGIMLHREFKSREEVLVYLVKLADAYNQGDK